MSNEYSDTHVPLIINKLSKEKYDELEQNNLISENEIYLVDEDNLDAASGVISNVGTPVSPTDAANKQYVDDSIPDNIVINNAGSNMNKIAIGCNAQAIGNYSIAMGCAQATSSYSIATGYCAQATNVGSIATGIEAQATGSSSIATGNSAKATSVGAQATGMNANAAGMDSIATGNNAQATCWYSIATGAYAQATGKYSIAMGCCAKATGSNSIAIGTNSYATAGGISIGVNCGSRLDADANTPIVIGNEVNYGNSVIRVTKDGVMTVGGKEVGKFETKTFTTDSQTGETDRMIIAKQENGVQPRLHAGDKDIHGVTGFSNESEKYTGQRYILDWDLAMSNDTSYLMGATKWTSNRFFSCGIAGPNTTGLCATYVQPLLPVNTDATTSRIFPYAIPCFENSPLHWKGHLTWDGGKQIYFPFDNISTNTSATVAVYTNNTIAIGCGAQVCSYSIATGNSAQATGSNSTAIGTSAQAKGYASTATGAVAQATGNRSIAAGLNAKAISESSIAIGCHAQAAGSYSIATGNSAQATGNSSIATGFGANAISAYSIAAGYAAKATGESSIATGYRAQATSYCSIAIGTDAKATSDCSMAIGTLAKATGDAAIAIGTNVSAAGDMSMVAGYNACAAGKYSTAIGYCAKAGGSILNSDDPEISSIAGYASIAIGNSVYAHDDYTIIIGANRFLKPAISATTEVPIVIGSNHSSVSAAQITVTNTGILSIGENPVAMQSDIPANIVTNNVGNDTNMLAIGSNTTTYADNSIAIGNSVKSEGIAIGYDTSACVFSIAMGCHAKATGTSSIAAGSHAIASGYWSIATSINAQATGDYSIATGNNAQATRCSSIAIGSNAKTGTILNPNNTETSAIVGESAIALGKNAYAQDDYTIAIGASKGYDYSVSASAAVPIVIGSDRPSVSAAQITVTSAGILNVGGNPVAMQEDLTNYVTTNTEQTISKSKTFENDIIVKGRGFGYTVSEIDNTAKEWIAIPDETYNGFINIKYANGLWVGCLVNGGIAYSEDGINWTMSTSFSAGNKMYTLDCNKNENIWVASIYESSLGFGNIIYSLDGKAWASCTTSTDLKYSFVYDIKYANGLWLAVTNNQELYYSTDGISWTLNENISAEYIQSYNNITSVLHYINNTWLLLGSYAHPLSYSSDGMTWTTTSMVNGIATDICYGNNKWIISFTSPSDNSAAALLGICYSFNLSDWMSSGLQQAQINNICYNNNGLFAASVYSNNSDQMAGVYYSTDGINWSQSSITENVQYICYSSNKWIAALANNTGLWYSEDCITWESSNIATGNYNKIYNNDYIIIATTIQDTLLTYYSICPELSQYVTQKDLTNSISKTTITIKRWDD